MRHAASRRSIGLALVVLTAGAGGGTPVQSRGVARAEPGLQVFEYELSAGSVRINLPSDAAVGSRVSGSILRTPAGSTSEALAANLVTLTAVDLEIGGVPIPAGATRFTFTVPAQGTGRYLGVRVGSDSPARAPFPWFVPLPTPAEPGDQFTLPRNGQTGRAVQIPGPFDGDAANTRARVGGVEAVILAESPRQAVVRLPLQPVGQTTLVLQEQGVTISAPIRNVSVDLAAPTTHLQRGQQTRLTLTVSGLAGLDQELPLRVVSGGAINTEGGSPQRLLIQPGDVGADGRFIATRTLTGTRTGDFEVTASVILPMLCNLQGQTVHVESDPSGSRALGKWWIYVKFPGGKPFKLWIDGAAKPTLRPCNWITVGACATDDDGDPIATGWTKVPDPTRKPPVRPPTAAGDSKPAPPPVPLGGDSVPPAASPCKEGEERNPSERVAGSFEVLAAWSKPDATFTWDAAGGQSAAIKLADFFEKGAQVGEKVGDRLPDVPATGPATLLLKYLEGGAKILKGVATSKVAYRASKVTFSITIETITYSASKWTVDVCHGGKWARETRCSIGTAASSVFKDGVTITTNDRDWSKIADPSNEAYLDPDRLNEFFTAWVKERLEKLAANAGKYAEFIKDCPR